MRRCVKEFAEDVSRKVKDPFAIEKALAVRDMYLNGRINEFDAMIELCRIELKSREEKN